MFSLVFAAYLIQQAESTQVANRVSWCLAWNDYSCNDREGSNNMELIECFLHIDSDYLSIKKAFNQAKDVICPIDYQDNIKAVINHSWSY